MMSSNIATVVIGVAEVAPVANNITYTVGHDEVLTTTATNGVLANYAGANTVPLAALPDQSTAAGQAFTVTLSASDPANDPLTFTARADTLAYTLEQQYGFHATGSPGQDARVDPRPVSSKDAETPSRRSSPICERQARQPVE